MQSYKSAELVILVIDCVKYVKWLERNPNSEMKQFFRFLDKLKLGSLLKNSENQNELFTKDCIVVFNKSDMIEHGYKHVLTNLKNAAVCISCAQGDGLDELMKRFGEKLKDL